MTYCCSLPSPKKCQGGRRACHQASLRRRPRTSAGAVGNYLYWEQGLRLGHAKWHNNPYCGYVSIDKACFKRTYDEILRLQHDVYKFVLFYSL